MYETVSMNADGDVIIKLINTGNVDIPVFLSILNLDLTNYSQALVTALAGEELTDTNNFTNPDKITPVTEMIGIAPEFTYEAAAYSVNIIRLVQK